MSAERLQRQIAELTEGIRLAHEAWSAYRDTHTDAEYQASMQSWGMLIAVAGIGLDSLKSEVDKLELPA